MSPTLVLFNLSLTGIYSTHCWALVYTFRLANETSRAIRVERNDLWPWLTSKRRYSVCSWDSRLRMTPVTARVRTPTWILVCRAGSDHKSWNWTWLRPSKENSGAACQSKEQTVCSINSAVIGETHKDFRARTCCSVNALYVSEGYLCAAAMQRSETQHFLFYFFFASSHLDCALFWGLKSQTPQRPHRTFNEILLASKGNFKCVPWSHWGPVNPGSHRQLFEPHSLWHCPLKPQEGSCSLLLQWSSKRVQPGTVLKDSAGELRSYS